MIERLYNLFLQLEIINWDAVYDLRLYKDGSGAIYNHKYIVEDDCFIMYSLTEWQTIDEGIQKLQKHLQAQ